MEDSTTDQKIQARFNFKNRNFNLPWYPQRGNRNDFAYMLAAFEFNKGVEVGTCQGVYSKILCSSNPNLHLTCVDPWMAYNGESQGRQDATYRQAVQALSGLNVTIIRKTSMDAVGLFKDESLDFVYIDGNHRFDFVMLDIIHWHKKVRKGGIVAAHDYHNQVGTDVISAINAYTRCHHIDPWYVTREEWPSAYWVRK